MKTNLLYIVFAVVLLTTAGWATEVDISRISLEKIGDETVCKIYADGPFQYTHEIPEQLPGKPYRVVVDIFPAVHNLDGKEFVNLPPSIVTSIRSSQFAVSPEKVVRVVFDLKETVPYRIEKKNNQVWVFLPDKSSAMFPQWSSRPQSASPIPQRAIADRPKTVSEITKTETDKSLTTPPQAVPEKPQIAKNEPPLMGAPAQNKPTAQKPETPPMVQRTEPPTETNAEQAALNPPPVAAPKIPAPKVASYYQTQKSTFLELDKSQTQKWVSQTSANKPIEIAQNAPIETEVTATQKPLESPAPAQNEAVEKDKVPVKTNEDNKEAEPAKADGKEQDTPFKKAKPVTAEGPSLTGEPILAGAASTQPDTAEIVPEAAGVVDDEDKPTSRFRRQPTLPAKLKGTMVAEFPTRMVIKYNGELSRDPFKTLIDETRKTDSQMQKRIPDIETLRLVGVIESANGKNRALLEDIDGFGYILGEGDKVKKGYVSRIDSNKAFFQLYEYGWSRTVALHLGDE
jgi:hypothetical protein